MPTPVRQLISEDLQHRVSALARQLRQRRKVLGVSVQNAAAAAGISRDTWYRIERGEITVTIGAWFNALSVLGLRFGLGLELAKETNRTDQVVPLEIRISEYPQLAALAWQMDDRVILTPREAFDVYERNARHLDSSALSPEESALIANLRKLF